jgi:hypothetical protein
MQLRQLEIHGDWWRLMEINGDSETVSWLMVKWLDRDWRLEIR